QRGFRYVASGARTMRAWLCIWLSLNADCWAASCASRASSDSFFHFLPLNLLGGPSMWNTGCRMIGNGLTVPINIVDGEDLHFAITVPHGGAADFNDVIFPWCKNGKEIREKAFRVSNVLTGASMPFMYLFQDYQINMIGFTLFSDDDSDLWGLGKTIDDGVMS